MLGLTAFLARRFNLQVLLILIALAAGGMINGAVQTWALGLNYYEVYWRSDVHMASIFAGAAMHLFMRSDSAASTLFKHTATTPVFGVVGVLLFVNIVPDPIKYTLGTLCLALSISALPSAYTPVRTMLSRPWILAVGAASYSLYVWQQPFFSTLDGELTLWPKLFQRAWHLVAVIPIAIVSYKFLEGPSRRALNRLWASRTGKTEAHLQEMDAKASSTEI